MMPFHGGLEALPNGTLVFSVGLALFYLLMLRRPPSWRRTLVKAGSVALLAVLAALQGGPVLLVAALAFSALGDAFLAHDGEKPFLAGLASFLVGHLVYVGLFVSMGGGLQIVADQSWRIALPLLAAAAALPLLARLMPAAGPTLRLPVAVYAVAILAMMATAATVPAPLVMVGAALFVASDGILATEKFLLAPGSPHRAWSGPAVWVLYYAAQLSIALGFLLAY